MAYIRPPLGPFGHMVQTVHTKSYPLHSNFFPKKLLFQVIFGQINRMTHNFVCNVLGKVKTGFLLGFFPSVNFTLTPSLRAFEHISTTLVEVGA